MHRALSSILLLLAFATAAHAQTSGLNLAWGTCTGSGTETYDKTSSCSGTTTQRLVGSFVVEQPIAVKEARWSVDFQVDARSTPTFWKATPARFAYSGDAANTACAANPWAQAEGGALTTEMTAIQTGPNRMRLGGIIFFNPGETPTLQPEVENFGLTLTIQAAGDAVDSDCQIKACFRFESLRLLHSDLVTTTAVETPAFRNHVSWQGTAVHMPCALATPARDVTWGSIKALYR